MFCNQMNKIFCWGLDMFYFVLIVAHKISCFSSCMCGETEVNKFLQGHLHSEWQSSPASSSEAIVLLLF